MLYSGTFTLTDEMDLLKGFGCSLSKVVYEEISELKSKKKGCKGVGRMTEKNKPRLYYRP